MVFFLSYLYIKHFILLIKISMIVSAGGLMTVSLLACSLLLTLFSRRSKKQCSLVMNTIPIYYLISVENH